MARAAADFVVVKTPADAPVAYGPGLAERVRVQAPGGVTAAADLFGTETAEAALALGVPPERITTIAAGPNPPGGVRATPADLERITGAILAGELTVPIAVTFPMERIREGNAVRALGPDPRRKVRAVMASAMPSSD
jgi:hypothetical protein